MCMFRRAQDLNMVNTLQCRVQDLSMIYHILLILEEKKDTQSLIMLICQALLVPIIFALNPEDRGIDPEIS